MLARGHRVTLLCGGPVAERPYRVVRNGGTYSQFLRAPLAYLRNFRHSDLIVEVCNGMPYLSPLWCRRPVLCLVNHVHTDLWSMRFRPPFSTIGRNIERVVMPWVHRRNLFLTVSESTAGALQRHGRRPGPDPADLQRRRGAGPARPALAGAAVPRDRAGSPTTSASTCCSGSGTGSGTWSGGKLVIAGDGPERPRLEALAGPGVVFTGRVSEQEKHRLLCAAWLLMHPALIEGWGIVVAEAAIRGTPAVAFDVPGLRDSVVHGQTGMLMRTEGQFASAWASLAINERQREQLGRAARTRALRLHWSAAVEGFAEVADEAIKRGRGQPCRLPRPPPQAARPAPPPQAARPAAPRAIRSRSFTRLRGFRSARARTGPGARPGCWPGCCGVSPGRP